MIDLLLLLLVLIAIASVTAKDLLSAGVLLSGYSLIMAVVWTDMNAVDVAFTEASVGAGITTVLLIATLSRTQRNEAVKPRGRHGKTVAAIVILTGLVLVYGTFDMPDYGDPEAPAHQHVAPRYIEEAEHETGVVNLVTAVLASYRGYDTLGETTVIFTAGMCVIMLLRRWPNG
jgi:multicomponent Na+:H+ antiporter subunit B